MKLGNLFKKEIKELLSPQAIFSIIFTCLLFVILGQFMGGVMDEAINNSTVNIRNLDNSEFTEKMLAALPEYGADPVIITEEGGLDELGLKNLVIIPEGFGESIEKGGEKIKLQCVSLVNGGGLSSTMSSMSASSLIGSIYDYVDEYTRTERLALSEEELALLDEPMVYAEYIEANGNTVEFSANMLESALMTQSMIAPMAVFFLVMMAAQMIMTAISTEKIDKTLETLLSAPVSRLSVLMAKLLAALVVALLNAASMIVGMLFYIQGMIGSTVQAEMAELSAAQTSADGISQTAALSQLGMSLSAGDIVLFGLQLFLTIAIGLSISLILGAMATDVKSVQTLTLPVMMMTMIPFFLTMFADVNSLSPVPKLVMYLIPFTHTYTALNNIMFGHMGIFWAGLVYQLIFFLVCMYMAVRMFTTDRLFTMSFSMGNMKAKGKKREKTAE